MRSLAHPRLIACVLAFGVCRAQSAGVAVLKEQIYHRDVSAKAIAYSRIVDSHGPYLSLVRGKTHVNIQRSKMVARVQVADGIPATILGEKDISHLREILGSLKDFTARYIQSESLLKPQIVALTAHISRFDAGEVRFEGIWISRIKLAEILETRRHEHETSEFAEVEKRVFDGGQRDKGLVLHDGKWMTLRETFQIPPESPTQLSECTEALWNGDLEGARSAVIFLSDLASQQTGAPKVRTERLITLVRNLFIAETRLTQQILASTLESYKATIQDKNAKAWLKPNGFGTIHYDTSQASREKAAEIRQRSAEGLEQCKRELIAQLVESEILAKDFFKLGEKRVAMILGSTVRAVSSRHFTESEFQPSPPPR